MTSLFGGGSQLVVGAAGSVVPATFTPTDGQTLFSTSAYFSYIPNTASLWVFVNGNKQRSGVDFTETSSTSFTLTFPVLSTDAIEVIGFPAAAITVSGLISASSNFVPENQTATAGQTLFTLTTAAYTPGSNSLVVYMNGLKLRKGTDYIETSTTSVTLVSGASIGDELDFIIGATLAASISAGVVGFIQSGTGAVARTVQDKARESVSVKDFGAVGDGVTNDTVAIQTAINYAAPLNIPVVFPSGTYIVTPATSQTGAASYNTALVMLSNMHIIGQHGATIKVSDNYSTNASPKELTIFSTVAHISNVTFEGITFDLNGANNLMSPSRPVSYNQFNHAAIMANGPTGYMDDVWIDKCIFKNTAGVCFVVTALVAAATSPPLGLRWKITNNLFSNGGLDTNDHTSVYAFCEDCLCEGNTFWQDNQPHTVGLTGGATGYEVHGSNHRFINNYVYRYTLGAYISGNFTNKTLNTIVSGNHIYCSDFGFLIYRGINMLELDGILVSNNTCYFDTYTYSGQPLYRAFLAFQGLLANQQGCSNIKIMGNYAFDTGVSGVKLYSKFVHWDTVGSGTVGANTTSNLSITDNQAVGFTEGVYLNTNSSNGLGLTEILRNQFISFNADSLGNVGVGLRINSSGGIGISTLVINDNQVIDERSPSHTTYGAYFSAGLITDLAMGNQTCKGMLGANFYNGGGVTITRSIGTAETTGATAVSDGGTIGFNADFTGFTPKAFIVTGGVAGEIVTVTSATASTFTVAIKKWTGGVLTAGTAQGVYWKAKF